MPEIQKVEKSGQASSFQSPAQPETLAEKLQRLERLEFEMKQMRDGSKEQKRSRLRALEAKMTGLSEEIGKLRQSAEVASASWWDEV